MIIMIIDFPIITVNILRTFYHSLTKDNIHNTLDFSFYKKWYIMVSLSAQQVADKEENYQQ